MTEIDLHGFKHDEVEMKKIVRETCEVQGFTIDDFWNDNPGAIILRS